mmetsp:Transcript_32362/g.84869  ORF Transcript_32362/g.84869 Transcript_32362/m.84869 type:complete len:122 (+) Transcript_32362:214-579(+)
METAWGHHPNARTCATTAVWRRRLTDFGGDDDEQRRQALTAGLFSVCSFFYSSSPMLPSPALPPRPRLLRLLLLFLLCLQGNVLGPHTVASLATMPPVLPASVHRALVLHAPVLRCLGPCP